MTKPLALLYCRVSSAMQVELGASLDAQESMLRAEAQQRGWSVEVIREEGKSAKSLKGREKLTDALHRLDQGKAHYLMAVRLDRVSRSVADFAGLLERARRNHWGIVLQSPNIDLSDPAGEFTANVLASAAQYERRLISVRTKEAMAQRKAEGQHMGRRADPAMLDAYARVLAMRAQGLSMAKIAAQLTAEGIPTARGGQWAAFTVKRMLDSETAKAMA
jgi:DNA invertase Pin-like site-specific DNA recombinase